MSVPLPYFTFANKLRTNLPTCFHSSVVSVLWHCGNVGVAGVESWQSGLQELSSLYPLAFSVSTAPMKGD